MNYGNADDLVAWALADLYHGRNVILGVPGREVGRVVLDKIAKRSPLHWRRQSSGSMETIDGAKVYVVSGQDQVCGIQANVYLDWNTPIGLAYALGPCEGRDTRWEAQNA